MISVFPSGEVWRFGLLVGGGATLVLDLWCAVMRLVGVQIVDWGRLILRLGWLLSRGKYPVLPFSPPDSAPPPAPERGPLRGQPDLFDIIFSRSAPLPSARPPARHSGWLPFMESDHPLPTPGAGARCAGVLLRYSIGISYALLLPLIWGPAYMAAPRLLPAVLIGLLLPSYLSLGLLVPLLGGGFFLRLCPGRAQIQALVLAAHAIFALGLFAFARLLAG